MKADCIKCKYYKLTWERKFPYACNLLGFKSARPPSQVVMESTGSVCEGFEEKGTERGGSGTRGQNQDAVIITIRNKLKDQAKE